jgi:hypothetical protein
VLIGREVRLAAGRATTGLSLEAEKVRYLCRGAYTCCEGAAGAVAESR